jgi:gas vesicle protein
MRHDDYDDEPTVVIEKHSGSVGSFLIGLAVGAGVALLLAPQSGEETRRRIGRGARDARERARDAADDLELRARHQVDRARGAVTDSVGRARRAVDLKREQVQRAVEAGRHAAQEAREDLERRIAETRAAYAAGADAARERLAEGRVGGPRAAEAPRAGGIAAGPGAEGDGDELTDLTDPRVS